MFLPVYNFIDKHLQEKTPFIDVPGGTRAGKTYNAIPSVIKYALTHPSTSRAISSSRIASKTWAHLSVVAIPFFVHWMKQFGIFNKKRFPGQHVYYWPNGHVTYFQGADDLHSAQGQQTDITLVDEAIFVKLEILKHFSQRTAHTMIGLYNPYLANCAYYTWADEKLKTGNAVRGQFDFYSNPYITDKQRREYEAWKITDPERWQVYGLGNRPTTSASVYPNREFVTHLPQGIDILGYGLDIGVTGDETALVEYSTSQGCFYAKLLFYQPTAVLSFVIQVLNSSTSGYHPIIMDAGGPGAGWFQDLKQLGFPVIAANKYPGSVVHGIQKVKENMPKFVQNEIWETELNAYNWPYDQINNVYLHGVTPTAKPHNALDALRYAATHLESKQNVSWQRH